MARIPESVLHAAFDAFIKSRQTSVKHTEDLTAALEAAFDALVSNPAVIEGGAGALAEWFGYSSVNEAEAFDREYWTNLARHTLRACLGIEEEEET